MLNAAILQRKNNNDRTYIFIQLSFRNIVELDSLYIEQLSLVRGDI